MTQIIDLIKEIGRAVNENKQQINLKEVKYKYSKPIQIDIPEEDEIDFVDDFSWVDEFEEEEEFVTHPAYKHQLEMEFLENKFLSRGDVRAKVTDIDYNEDPWERQRRLERLGNKFLLR